MATQPESDDVLATFSKRLDQLMEECGETPTSLSAKLQRVSKSSLSGYTLGRSMPGGDAIVALARHFRVSSDFLLGLTDDRTEMSGRIKAGWVIYSPAALARYRSKGVEAVVGWTITEDARIVPADEFPETG